MKYELEAKAYIKALQEGWSTSVARTHAGLKPYQVEEMLELHPDAQAAYDKYCDKVHLNFPQRYTTRIRKRLSLSAKP